MDVLFSLLFSLDVLFSLVDVLFSLAFSLVFWMSCLIFVFNLFSLKVSDLFWPQQAAKRVK